MKIYCNNKDKLSFFKEEDENELLKDLNIEFTDYINKSDICILTDYKEEDFYISLDYNIPTLIIGKEIVHRYMSGKYPYIISKRNKKITNISTIDLNNNNRSTNIYLTSNKNQVYYKGLKTLLIPIKVIDTEFEENTILKSSRLPLLYKEKNSLIFFLPFEVEHKTSLINLINIIKRNKDD